MAEEKKTVDRMIPGRGVLRVSIINTCNYQCSYCHNEGQDVPWSLKPIHANLYDLNALVRYAAKHGCKQVNITGGEPGLYPELESLYDAQRSWKLDFPEIREWVFNTNGTPFLGPIKFMGLAQSGFTRINVGIDSLLPAERSKPDSPNGADGLIVFASVATGLTMYKPVKIDVVYTGDDGRVFNLIRLVSRVRGAFPHPLTVAVIEQNGVMGYDPGLSGRFNALIDTILSTYSLTPTINPITNEVETEWIKFYQDHKENIRPIDFRFVPTSQGLAHVPYFQQSHKNNLVVQNGIIAEAAWKQAVDTNGVEL